MKLGTNGAPVSLNGMSEAVTGFKIEANAKAFRALSSTLYKDQIGSVLREIVCNGMDANKMSGSTLPVEVKLPNEVNPTFYVRDTGPGLSEEDVKSLYSTYFASTKDQSNDQIGAFGLGSKSPFAYTDSFTVVSAHGGMKKTYAAFLSEAGDPSILKVAEEPVSSNWEHGLEVGFPVRPKDFGEFEAKALAQLKWLDPLPILKGVASKLERPEIQWKFGNFMQLNGSQSNRNTPFSVIMGGVAYGLGYSDIEAIRNYWGSFSESDSSVAFTGLCLEVPLGAVEVSLSRESLSMTEFTVKALATIVDQNVQQLRRELAEEREKMLTRSLAETHKTLIDRDLVKAAFALLGWDRLSYKAIPKMRSLDDTRLDMQLKDVAEYLPFHGVLVKNFYHRKTTTSGFMLEEGAPQRLLFGLRPDQITWFFNDKGYSDDGVRTRVRSLIADQATDQVAIGLDCSSGDVLNEVIGVPVPKLSEVALPKKQKPGEGVARAKFGMTALLADAKRLNEPMVYVQNPNRSLDVSTEGPLPDLKEGEVGYFVRVDLSNVHSLFNGGVAMSVASWASGLNSALTRLGLPAGNFLYAVHRKTDRKKAEDLGYADLTTILLNAIPEVEAGMASSDIRHVLAATRKQDHGQPGSFVNQNSPSILLRTFHQFPAYKRILEGTWIAKGLDELLRPDFVSIQEDYICLSNLLWALQPDTKIRAQPLANKDSSNSRWPAQEALFRKLNLPEIWTLGYALSNGLWRDELELAALAFLNLLRLKPEPETRLQAVA